MGGPAPGHKYKAIARNIAYHGTTFGALSINGIPALRTPFEPLVPEVRHVSNTNRYHRPPEETEEEFTAFLLDELERTILEMDPETVCLVHMEPVQNAGGSFIAPAGYWKGVRELCDRYDILLSADEVITGFGRVGHWFASERYDIRPDIVTCAKGLSSSYAAIGAVVATDRVMEPFLHASSMYTHGITFGGHPVMSAIALRERWSSRRRPRRLIRSPRPLGGRSAGRTSRLGSTRYVPASSGRPQRSHVTAGAAGCGRRWRDERLRRGRSPPRWPGRASSATCSPGATTPVSRRSSRSSRDSASCTSTPVRPSRSRCTRSSI